MGIIGNKIQFWIFGGDINNDSPFPNKQAPPTARVKGFIINIKVIPWFRTPSFVYLVSIN